MSQIKNTQFIRNHRAQPLTERALEGKLNAYDKAKQKGLVKNSKLTLVDYSLPATQPRMWVIDMKDKKLLAQHLVTHGVKSNDPQHPTMATSFSNVSGSNKTSLGTYIVGNKYNGSFGYSAYVRGLEAGFNDHANARAIRIHEYENVDAAAIDKYHNISNTEGCFGINKTHAHTMIDMIKSGSVLLAYADDPAFLAGSKFIK